MLRLEINPVGQEEWTRLASGFSGLSLMQSWEYAEAKARTGPWRVERGVFTAGGVVAGVVQALVRPLPVVGGGLAWINRGPLFQEKREQGQAAAKGDPALLAAMLRELRAHYVDRRGMVLRLAPAVPDGFPDPVSTGAVGLKPAGTPGWASAVIDLSPSVEDLRKNLQQKWRNGLSRAEREGLEVRQGTGDDLFRIFLDGHVWLMKVKGFATTVTPELLSVLRSLFRAEGRMETIAAFHEGTAAATALIVRYGDTAEYLAGNTSDEGRRISAGQMVLWRAVTSMKEKGCRRFDLGGLDDVLTPPGIARFKAGLGGVPYRLAAELESTGGGLRGRLVRWRVSKARTEAAA